MTAAHGNHCCLSHIDRTAPKSTHKIRRKETQELVQEEVQAIRLGRRISRYASQGIQTQLFQNGIRSKENGTDREEESQEKEEGNSQISGIDGVGRESTDRRKGGTV